MRDLARIIDANANRAREALRVMEDAARFGLDREDLTAEIKAIRHALREALARLPLPPGLAIAARDTPGDVGVGVKGSGEGLREDLRSIATAAGKRLTEALRAIEECAKAVDGSGAGWSTVESLRYRAYDVEQRLALAWGVRAPQWRLCVLISADLCAHAGVSRDWREVARAAVRGGADCLQLREKTLEGAALLAAARELVAIAREFGGAGGGVRGGAGVGVGRPAVIINDRPDIALLAGADGVHVGQGDLPVAACRRVMGAGAIVGVSTSSIEQARAALRDGASYVGLGPMYPSTTKAKPALAGLDYLRAYLADEGLRALPHLAISGIDAERARALAAAGCRGVAVSSAVCSAEDPEGAVRAIVGHFA